MKKIAIVLISILNLAQGLFAENRVSFIPKEATVYLSGAKLTGVTSVDLPAGNSEVVFEKLSPNVYAPSLQIKVNGNAKVLSAQFRAHYPEVPNVEAPVKILQDSITLIQEENSYLSGKIGVYEAEKHLINSQYGKVGTPIQGNTVVQITPNDFKDLSDYYRNRMMEILDKTRELSKSLTKNNLLINRLQQKIYNLAPKALPTEGEIVVQMNSAVAQRIELTCIYLINQAGWTPLYDITTEGTDKPVKLTYKASIFQSSGLDWKNVKLSVSTANPF
ncbi:MAG: mucoidy inhibitor MuiA family protein [Bacteroidia bacterium]